MLVLVAHTDRWTRLLVRDVVTEAGSAVVEASNGMAALRLAQRTHPDLVLLGPTLSEIDPRDVIGALRQDAPTRSIPVLMLRDERHGGVPVMRVRCARNLPVRTRRRALRRGTRHAGASSVLLQTA